MHKLTENIIELIKRFLLGESSQEELAKLEEWLQENPDHPKLLKRFQDESQYLEDVNFLKGLNKQKAWEKLSAKRPSERRHLKKSMSYLVKAACVFIPILFLSIYFSLPNLVQEEESDFSSVEVLPATPSAQLKLANGDVYRLEYDNLDIRNDDYLGQKKNAIKNSNPDISSNKPAEISNVVVEVPKASYFSIVLSDGTKVKINAQSSLEFPESFSNAERRVKLDGEAYFEVEKDPSKPFIVEVNGVEVEVLGTKFNINSYEKEVKTTLAEGSVKVVAGDEMIRLKPGEQSVFVDSKIIKKNVDIEYYLSWVNNEFVFKRDNLRSILKEISRWYGVELKLTEEPEFYKRQITGNISRQVTLSELCEMLEFVNDVSLEIKDGYLFCTDSKKGGK